MRVAVTDSGLGGLSVCASVERAATRRGAGVSLTFVNAWPEVARGYNDFPDAHARAAVFDLALAGIARLRPHHLLVACNTLSILYPLTMFSRHAPCPVHGIIDAGVAVFADALRANPDASIALIGTRTTIESAVHRARLETIGIEASRIVAVACHGLATAIERDVDGPRAAELIATCAADIRRARPAGSPLFVGLCCTHFGYVADRITAAVRDAVGREAITLDPNTRMARDLEQSLWPSEGEADASADETTVEVVSKVTLDERTRTGIASLVRPVSARTADALLAYRHEPGLF